MKNQEDYINRSKKDLTSRNFSNNMPLVFTLSLQKGRGEKKKGKEGT